MKNLMVLTITIVAFFGSYSLFGQSDSSMINSELGSKDSIFASFAALTLAVPFITEMLKNMLGKVKATPGLVSQVLSWLVSLGVMLFGWIFEIGFLAETEHFYMVLFYALGAGLISNGIADTKIIVKLFTLVKRK